MTTETAQPFEDVWYQSKDGLKLYARHYRCTGVQRASILCMHGLTRNSADFSELCERLRSDYELIVADQRGRGRSEYDSDQANYQPLVYVQDMFVLLDELGIESAILIGTSMGGLMAMTMASMQAERVCAMVLNDIGPEVDPAGLQRIMSYAGKVSGVSSWSEAAQQTEAVNSIAFPDYGSADWQKFARKLYVEDANGVPQLAYDPAIAQAIDNNATAAVPVDLWPMFEALGGIPTLVIRGATSDILSADCVARMRSCHPLLSAVEVPGRGHAPMLDEPEAESALNDFLAGLDNRG